MVSDTTAANQSSADSGAMSALRGRLSVMMPDADLLRVAGWAITNPAINSRDQRLAVTVAVRAMRDLNWHLRALPGELSDVIGEVDRD